MLRLTFTPHSSQAFMPSWHIQAIKEWFLLMEIGEAQQINQNAGFRVIRERRLLCLSFFVCLPSGRCSAETANFMFFWCCPYTVQS